jgi:hypothetical protein
MTDIPVLGRPGETIEALTDEEVCEVVECEGDGGPGHEFPASWVYALACEVQCRRLQVELLKDERDRYKAEAPSDRGDLSTAAFELKERRNNYDATRQQFIRAGTDQEVVAVWDKRIAEVDAAIECVERLAKGGG